MAQDIFVKIDGITGESPDADFKDQIQVLSWDWQVLQDPDNHKGLGGGSAKATIKDLNFVHYLDRASPNLMLFCLKGTHIKEVTLTVRKAGGTPMPYLKYTLSDVLITGVFPQASADDPKILERVSLSFAQVKQEYTAQNKDGTKGAAVTAGFDIKANKQI